MTSLRRPPMHCPCRRELSGQLIGSANAGDGRRTESCSLETGTKVTPSARSMLTPEDAGFAASARAVVPSRHARHVLRNQLHPPAAPAVVAARARSGLCLLYTSDAADDLLCVDLG